MNEAKGSMRIVLHAPTRTALRRARANAANVRKEAPETQVRIIANAEAVAEAIECPDPASDPLTGLCPNTLRRLDLEARPPLEVLAQAAVLALASLQQEGWLYIRA